ncbi:MAG: hypothetical protein Q7S74_01415 [Nanoarchaeota archaeon]|nr:hypothetical protein [Nanoarchaeota archaeon]
MEKLQVALVIEILGRPPEHVKEAINTIVVKLGSEKGVKILNKKYHDPIPVEGTKDLFTTFVEIEAELDSLDNYYGIIFAYMPAHIEIIKPENFSLSNGNLTETGNRLLQRLHDYDSITKTIVTERDILLKKLMEVAPHLFKQPQKVLPSLQQPSSKPQSKKPSSKKKTKKKK